MTKLLGQIKLPSVNFVIDYSRFDIAECEYDNQSALSTPKFKEKIFKFKNYVCNKNIIFNLITIFSVTS